MNIEDLQKIAITRLNEELEDYGYDMINPQTLIPSDKDELHDFFLTGYVNGTRIEDDDSLYQEMCSLISDEDTVRSIIDSLESEYDLMSYDPWREHCDKDFYGV